MSDSTATENNDRPCILITGTSRNIGAHLAHRCLEAGYRVLAQYRSGTDAVQALADRGAIPIQGELSDGASCLAIAEQVKAYTPALRAIIHNASAYTPTATDIEAIPAQFEAFFQVHMLGPYLLSRRLAPRLRGVAGAPADIVHITDVQADDPPAEYDIYCATKAGLQSLTLSLARRLSPDIKVNAIQPGPIDSSSDPTDDTQAVIEKNTLLGYSGTSEAIWHAVRALLANTYQTGAVVPVDGGKRLVG